MLWLMEMRELSTGVARFGVSSIECVEEKEKGFGPNKIRSELTCTFQPPRLACMGDVEGIWDMVVPVVSLSGSLLAANLVQQSPQRCIPEKPSKAPEQDSQTLEPRTETGFLGCSDS